MNTRVIGVLLAALICITMAAPAMAQPSPFVITGQVSDSDSSPCNEPWVRITNTNTSVSWDAENDSASNYYKLVLDSGDVSVGNILSIEASGCSKSKTVTHTVAIGEIDCGGFIEDITFEAAAKPDLIVTTLDTPANLRNDVINPISATVENIGASDAGSFNVSLDVDGIQVDTATIATLAAGENTTVELLWTPAATGGATLTVTADADDSVDESDETNNDLPETVDVLPKLTVTANVRIEGKDEMVWTGDVTFSSSVLTATDGSIHYLNEPTALGALDEADKLGEFGYVLVKYDWGLYVSEVAGESAIGWDGWMYRVNYVSPPYGAQDYTLADDDEVLWYFGTWTAPPLAIELSGTEVNVGENFTATVTAYNDTSAEFEPVNNATVYVDGLTFQTGTDGNATLSLGTAGDYTVYADKGTWANYTRSEKVDVTVIDESKPDLIIWVTLNTPGYVNEDNILGARVKNNGTVDAGSFNVSLSVDGTSMGEQTVPSLAAGETTEIEYVWTPTELGGHALSATVDTNNDIEESNETNNDFARTSVIIKRTDWYQFHYDEVHSGFSPSGAPDTNTTLWISDELSAIGGTSTVVADGKVFAYGGPTSPYGSGEGVLYCLDEFTGAIIWNISIPTPAYGSWSSPAYHNGRVFTSTDIEAGCYDATTGEQIWVFENPSNGPSVNGGPVVADGKVIVNDWQSGHYYCLDEETGELLWTFTEEQTGSWSVGYTQGTPAYADGKFYLTTWLYVGGNVYCVDADTGDEIWNQTTPLDTCGSPAVVDGTVYVTNYDFSGYGAIYAMDASNGDILWHQPIQRSDSTPSVAYGNVYVTGGCLGYSDRQTYCFDAATGNLTWSTDTADAIGAWTCSVAVADGKVFVGTEGGDFFDYAGTYALDAFTGDLIWSHPEGGSSPAVADNIVFTIGGGRVYAFCDPLPDLTVAAIETPTNLRNDVINPISATITNVGGSAAENFVVSLDVGGTQVDTATIATLAAGENTTVELLWTPATTGGATLTVTADADDSVEELDETNNDLAETVDVLPKLTITANVRIEGKNETVWTGDVTFSNSTIMASDGSVHYLNEPTALGALDEANELGGFGYVVESHPIYGLYIAEINNELPIGWDGWMYRVNYVSPWVGAADYTLADSDEVLWYFGAWTAPPLAIELSATEVSPGEEFVATVTAYNGTSAEFEPVDNATVYADGLMFQTGIDGNATLSIDIAGDYMVYADKGTWAEYTRSEKKSVTVLSVESYGESVYAKKNTRLAWRALGEPDDRGAVLFRNARIAIELEETIPSCKEVSVRVVRLGFQTVNFDVAVSSDGTNWDTIGSGTCGAWMTWVDCDFDGDFGDVRYIKITKPGTWWNPRLMGLDAVYATN